MLTIITKSAAETAQLGERIGAFLVPKAVILLEGELGAGKTTFVQGLAKGLGIKEYVTSPTFIIINEHPGKVPLYHIDLYRLLDLHEIEDLGIEEYFDGNGVCVVEWAEKLQDFTPKKFEKVNIRIISENERKLLLSDGLALLVQEKKA